VHTQFGTLCRSDNEKYTSMLYVLLMSILDVTMTERRLDDWGSIPGRAGYSVFVTSCRPVLGPT
jgi:hypothetical protein